MAISPQAAITAGRGLTVVTTEDVDMDAPSGFDACDLTDPDSPLSEDDSQEMRILKEESRRKTGRRILPHQLHSLQVPSPKDMIPSKAATEIIREGFTVNPALPIYYLVIIDSIDRKWFATWIYFSINKICSS